MKIRTSTTQMTIMRAQPWWLTALTVAFLVLLGYVARPAIVHYAYPSEPVCAPVP